MGCRKGNGIKNQEINSILEEQNKENIALFDKFKKNGIA